jgi:translation initiation factor IF-3
VQKVQREKVNEQIKAPQIRLIDEEGNQLGLMAPAEALELAREREMDLVEVAPLAKPPVCRIIDYGKFQYQHAKVSKVKQKKIEVKGLRIGFKTDDHDLEVKINQTTKFLEKGNKVKIEIRLKGREKMHKDKARENLQNFIRAIQTPHETEQEIKPFPGGFNVILMPKK